MPKLFISYCWTDPEYQESVLRLATDLRENGVEVILDKWHLREGDDAHAFMEQMVTDPTVDKVLILCNRKYKQKADGRDGGVGTETQIITPELYGKKSQDKFVVGVMERMEDGSECVPAYYKSRIHLDFTKPEDAAETFERLLRWIYNKPLHVAPPLGAPPAFLGTGGGEQAVIATATLFRRAQDAVRNHKPFAMVAVSEYFSKLAEEMEKFRISEKTDNMDDHVVESVSSFLPYRNECLTLINDVAANIPGEDAAVSVQRFLEKIARYGYRPEHITEWKSWDFDNYIFIVHEIFLYSVAIFIKHERFSDINILCGDYYAPYIGHSRDNAMEGYAIFWQHIQSLDARNRRMKLNRISVHADMLKERSAGLPVSFGDLIQADFVLYLRSIISGMSVWFPETLLYAERSFGQFEIFARAKSKRYLAKVLSAIGASSKDAIDKALAAIESERGLGPYRSYQPFAPPPRRLMGYEYLGLSE